MSQTGVLLVNLGTPKSPSTGDVRRYLNEFLLDPRVMDMPWLKRQLLVRGIISPFRAPKSAATYKAVWTEAGSPLLVYGEKLRDAVAEKLGATYQVELAMRYQEPAIPDVLEKLRNAAVKRLVILPLFPQYASATTGSVHQKVMETVKHWQVIPTIRFISHFPDHPKMIKAFAGQAKAAQWDRYDHLLFSYHGLPARQIHKAAMKRYCQINNKCCSKVTKYNSYCYRAQCFATTRAIVKALDIPDDKYEITFQSRLGKTPWLEPFTSDRLPELAQSGKKRVLVFCPSFICDCLETTYEISEEYAAAFKSAGGEHLQLVEGLNLHPAWVEAVQEMVGGG